MSNLFKIESGKFYKTRDGRTVGPVSRPKDRSRTDGHPFTCAGDAAGFDYTPEGRLYTDDFDGGLSPHDLVEEVTN